jgi:hypothetical protein
MEPPADGVSRRAVLGAVAAAAALPSVASGDAVADHEAGHAAVGYGTAGFGRGGYGAAVLEPIGTAAGPPTDPDGDGRYEDVDGDGVADVADVLHYYEHRRSAVVQAAPACFDFDGDGVAGTVSDALALYERSVR